MLLNALLLLPLIGALLLCFFRPEQDKQIKTTAIFFAVVTFVASLPLLGMPLGNIEVGGMTFHFAAYQSVELMHNPQVTWSVGLDGLSVFLVLLTTFLTVIVMLYSYQTIHTRVREYFIAFLLLETGMIGALVALDVMMFYLFWELMLIPMYLIIGIWGHDGRRKAAIKFFLFTLSGSLFMFVALVYCYLQLPNVDPVTGAPIARSFSLLHWYAYLTLPHGANLWVFAALAFSFAIKVPLFPVHTWLPEAHVEAPTAGSVILAGVLLKMGTYGYLRFGLPLFPVASEYFAPVLMVLATIGILYGAWMAWVQDDMKKLVAYSSVSHLGFAVLGIFAATSMVTVAGQQLPWSTQGISGSVFIMVSHGLTTGALFLLVGMLYERRHTRLVAEFGGLAKSVPVLAVLMMIATLGSVGLPMTSGFVGEFSVLMAAFLQDGSFVFPWFWEVTLLLALGGIAWAYMAWKTRVPDEDSGIRYPIIWVIGFGALGIYGLVAGNTFPKLLFAAVGGLGVIFGAVYMLSLYRRAFFGPLTKDANKTLPDATGLEKLSLYPVLALVLLLGIAPTALVLNQVDTSARDLMALRDARLLKYEDRAAHGDMAWAEYFRDRHLTRPSQPTNPGQLPFTLTEPETPMQEEIPQTQPLGSLPVLPEEIPAPEGYPAPGE